MGPIILHFIALHLFGKHFYPKQCTIRALCTSNSARYTFIEELNYCSLLTAPDFTKHGDVAGISFFDKMRRKSGS